MQLFRSFPIIATLGLLVGPLIGQALPAQPSNSPDKTNLYGVAYSPYRKPGPTDIAGDIKTILGVSHRIRLYGCENKLLTQVLDALKGVSDAEVYAGIWYDSDPQSFSKQLEEFKAAMTHSDFSRRVKAVIVGNEAISSKQANQAQVIERIGQVRNILRGAGQKIPVTTAETIVEYTSALIDAVDIIMPNLHAYFDGVAIGGAVEKTFTLADTVRARDSTKKKPLFIGETGWPSEGQLFKQAQPSKENAKRFLDELPPAAAKRGVNYFYFEAFDQSTKGSDPQGVEKHWGIFTSDGKPKFS